MCWRIPSSISAPGPLTDGQKMTPRQRDYRDLGGSASDVDDQVPARLLNWQPGPDRRRDRPLDEIHVVRPGMLCGIADRPPFDLRDSRGNADHHPRLEDRAKPPLRP